MSQSSQKVSLWSAILDIVNIFNNKGGTIESLINKRKPSPIAGSNVFNS